VKQFDIIENPNRSSRSRYPFLLVLQHDRLSEYSGVVVAPLYPSSPSFEKTRLHPVIAFGGADYALITEELAAVQRSRLGPVIGSAAEYRYAIIGAIDLVFTGF
jgi:toxin CcdB